MSSFRCADCDERTPHAYRLCDDCLKASTIASRAAQGLPPTIESPLVLDRIIDILDAADSPPSIFQDPAAVNRAAVIFRRALARPGDDSRDATGSTVVRYP